MWRVLAPTGRLSIFPRLDTTGYDHVNRICYESCGDCFQRHGQHRWQSSYEMYVIEHGRVVHPQLHAAAAPAYGLMLAKVREAADCPECELCDACDATRTASGCRCARTATSTYATAILTLNAHEFTGGYFVISRDRDAAAARGGGGGGLMGEAAARQLHLPLASGDLLVRPQRAARRQRDLRLMSLIGWYKDRGLCASDANPGRGAAEARRGYMFLLSNQARRHGDEAAAQLGRGARPTRGTRRMILRAMGLFRSSSRAEPPRPAARHGRERRGRARRDGAAGWALDKGAGGAADPVAARGGDERRRWGM